MIDIHGTSNTNINTLSYNRLVCGNNKIRSEKLHFIVGRVTPFGYKEYTIMDEYIELIKEKLRICTDYVEREVRMYIYQSLLYRKENDKDYEYYKKYYGRHLELESSKKLKSPELIVFDEIEDAVSMLSVGIFSHAKDNHIKVQRDIKKTIQERRNTIRNNTVDKRISENLSDRDYIIEFVSMEV